MGRLLGRCTGPGEWIETSTTPLSIGSDHYGYQWRLGPESYWALGWRGQRIEMVPELAMVVVFLACL